CGCGSGSGCGGGSGGPSDTITVTVEPRGTTAFWPGTVRITLPSAKSALDSRDTCTCTHGGEPQAFSSCAIASSSGSPRTSGRVTVAGPVDTTSATAVPSGTSVPGCGVAEITRPSSTSSEGCSATSPTVSPASTSIDSAVCRVSPTTSGTVTVGG